MTPPRVVIGVPLYNGADHLAEALDSLLLQSYRCFGLVLVDDCSSDNTPEIASRYAEHDHRITFERRDRRLGMTESWGQVFLRARALYPDLDYFAWASDHDVWHPRWLRTLVDVLDEESNVVMAYTNGYAISDQGELGRLLVGFENAGVSALRKRFPLTVDGMAAGNMIYGLFRADMLERCGPFASVLLPDRLLLAKLSLHGEFRQVPEHLWYRRYREGASASFARQRRSFFPDGVPLYGRLPWWMPHAAAMSAAMADDRQRPAGTSPLAGQAIAAWYLELSLAFWWRRRLRRARKGAQRFRKRNLRRARRAARRSVAASRRLEKALTRVR